MLTKDEIRSSFNVGFCKELSTSLSEDGVLETDKFAGVVTLVLLIVLVTAEQRESDSMCLTLAAALTARACPPLP